MRKLIKTSFILPSLFIFLSIAACKKPSQADFRDALVGTYSCTIHQWQYYRIGQPPNTTTGYFDSIIGTDTLVVTKSGSGNTIVAKGTAFSSLDSMTASTVIYSLNQQTNPWASISFFSTGDSVVYLSGSPYDNYGDTEGTSYKGHKVR